MANLFDLSRNLLDEKVERQLPDDKYIWITEYNLLPGGREDDLSAHWIHGLYVVTMSAVFLEDQRISMACNHVLLGNGRMGAIFFDESVIGQSALHGKKVNTFDLTATGYAMELYGRALLGKDNATRLRFNRSANSTPFAGLYGWAFSGSEGTEYLVLNLTSKALGIDRPHFPAGGAIAHIEQLSGQADKLVTAENDLLYTQKEAGQSIALPPYSITRLYSE